MFTSSGSRTGKSILIVNEALRTNRPILCKSKEAKEYYQHLALALGYVVSVYTVDDLKEEKNGASR